MPEGQFSGPKRLYSYISDSGEVIRLKRDVTLATVPGTGLNEISAGSSEGSRGKPDRFKPRGVYWEGVINGRLARKFIICNSDGVLYTGNVSQQVTVDGVAGVTTGKRGEQQSFDKIAPAATP